MGRKTKHPTRAGCLALLGLRVAQRHEARVGEIGDAHSAQGGPGVGILSMLCGAVTEHTRSPCCDAGPSDCLPMQAIRQAMGEEEKGGSLRCTTLCRPNLSLEQSIGGNSAANHYVTFCASLGRSTAEFGAGRHYSQCQYAEARVPFPADTRVVPFSSPA
ncbi:hypothetical protein BX600DRAFT_429736 [Xylariales sp. PMI_506]|nr:hypothetical protein BX600DRAFT_429736 [Xylariales sp. PMI_506]